MWRSRDFFRLEVPHFFDKHLQNTLIGLQENSLFFFNLQIVIVLNNLVEITRILK